MGGIEGGGGGAGEGGGSPRHPKHIYLVPFLSACLSLSVLLCLPQFEIGAQKQKPIFLKGEEEERKRKKSRKDKGKYN